jgi:hypothetical protein
VKPDPVVVAARFQHQYALARIGGQAVGHDAAGGARPHDDIVEITFKLPHLFIHCHARA